jgi:dimethylhistidine N-methyltransferase
MPVDGFFAPDRIDQAVVAAVLPGLLSARKTLPPKLFYDEEGCRLFAEITELPEYYLTRTERQLLEVIAPSVAALCPPGCALVEYGASDEGKAEFLLRQRDPSERSVFSAYVPIDVAETALQQTVCRLHVSHADLRVHPVVADFLCPVSLPACVTDKPRFGFFPGSTIGNLEPEQAVRFLEQVRDTLGWGSRLLVGVDLRKDAALLIPAYDDASGITTAFNRNILTRLNREAGADFDVSTFSHSVIWNDIESRIEMHLVSECAQVVQVAGRRITFRAGETIHTENSYKWTVDDFIDLARRAGWVPRQVWNDSEELFSIHLLEIKQP